MKPKLAVFASGSGSNFQAIVDAVESNRLDAEISLLVCDRPGVRVIERAEKKGIPAFVFSPKDYESKVHFEQMVVSELEGREVCFIALAGYMRLIGTTLLNRYSGKIVNIHPSLLPSFPGKDAARQALSAGVKITGVTIHYVDEGMDTGTIIAQEPVAVMSDDDLDTLQNRIQQVEHDLYPRTLSQLLRKESFV